jgi:acyl carrier protein
MAATVSSRTPEGEPNLCPVCRTLIRVEPSTPSGDAPCPSCGVLLWFLHTSKGVRLYEVNRIAEVRERVMNILARMSPAGREGLGRPAASLEDFGADSLDIMELVMELEEEFDFTMAELEAQQIRTIGDLVDWLIRHLR